MMIRPTLAVVVLGTLLGIATAPAPADPMRPLAPPLAAASAGGAASAASSNASTAQPALQSDRLVAIRRDADGRYQALIGERWVGLGDKVGGRAGSATVRALDGRSVTLEHGRQRLVMHVLPPLVASSGDPGADRSEPPAPRTAALGHGVRSTTSSNPSSAATASPRAVP